MQTAAQKLSQLAKEPRAHVEPDTPQGSAESKRPLQLRQPPLFSCGIQNLFIEGLEDQRNSHKDCRPLFTKVFPDGPHAFVQVQRAAAVQSPSDTGHHLKGVAQREEGQSNIPLREREHPGQGADLTAHVAVREHDAAGFSGRAGGKVHGGNGLRPERRKTLVLFRPQLFYKRVQLQNPKTGDRLRKG